jgi:hypothetical protein
LHWWRSGFGKGYPQTGPERSLKQNRNGQIAGKKYGHIVIAIIVPDGIAYNEFAASTQYKLRC